MGNKLKLVGRVIIEMFVIWLVFEWNNKWIIEHIMLWFDKVNLTPYMNELGGFLNWLSPYSRPIATGEVLNWLNISSGIVLFCAIITMYIALSESFDRFFYKVLIVILVNFAVWYAFLGISYFMAYSSITGTVNRWLMFLACSVVAEAIAFYLQYFVFDIDDEAPPEDDEEE